MNKIIYAFMLLAFISILYGVEAKIFTVDDDGNADFRHIQDAIDNANNGDIIFVYSGIYRENVVIDKSIKLIGENVNTTIIDAEFKDDVICVYWKNVEIAGFTISNSGKNAYPDFDCGIEITHQNVSIKNCKIINNLNGVMIKGENVSINHSRFEGNKNGIHAISNYNIITNCIFKENEKGVFMQNNKMNKVTKCSFYYNIYGLHSESSSFNEVKNCYFYHNDYGLFFEWVSDNNSISRCDFIENYINGLKFSASTDGNIVSLCNVIGNDIGIEFYDTSNNNRVLFCNIKNNEYGVLLHWIFTAPINRVNFNNISGNTEYGVYAEQCIVDASNNWWGSADGPSGIGNGDGDAVNENVLFEPWLTKEAFNSEPWIRIVYPRDGGVFKGLINITGEAWDENCIAWIEVGISGKWYRANGKEKWYFIANLEEGENIISARCFDFIGYSYDTVNVIIDNTPPKIKILSPRENVVKKRLTIRWIAEDKTDLKIDIFYFDGKWHKIASNEENDGIYIWDISDLENGKYKLRINATDMAGNVGSNETFFVVNNNISITNSKLWDIFIFIFRREILHIPHFIFNTFFNLSPKFI